MLRKLLVIILICFQIHHVWCQNSLSGIVFESKTTTPIGYALVVANDNESWAVTNDKGEFLLKNLPKGNIFVTISCLGYVKKTFELKVAGNIEMQTFYLSQDNLILQEVVVTARTKSNELASSYVIDRLALEHIQMLGVADAMSLLPGGQTNRNLHLATSNAQTITLRAGASYEEGNAAFGTAIEVDGVRLSNNAAIGYDFSQSSRINASGIDTRNIAASNIESMEVVTGIPSVAYGDMTQGIVRVNTRKGRSPFQAEMITNPNTQSFSLSKGFGLGNNAGTLNANYEWAKSISDPASPYTSYKKNAMSLLYANTLMQSGGQPLSLTLGVTGNVGGYNSEDDPDRFTGAYAKIKDNTLRVNTRINYQLNLPWISNLELTAVVNYSDKIRETRSNKSSSASVSVLHGRENGYFAAQVFDENPNAPIVIIPPGYWFQTMFSDDKPIDITASMKARWVKKTGSLRNNVLLGADFSRTGNKGKGIYPDPDDFRNAPTWREDRFDEYPYMNNLAIFAEDKADLRINNSVLQLMAGVRSDITMIESSEYGTVSSLSPRFNAKYIFPENLNHWLENLNIRAGYGKSVKLPSFGMLYPRPVYRDIEIFASSVSGNENFTAYNILPYSAKYNPDLKWQYSNQLEAGLNARIKGVSIELTFFQNKTMNRYDSFADFEPFSYNYSNTEENRFFLANSCPIPLENRRFAIDKNTGIVNVFDITGQLPTMELPYRTEFTFQGRPTFANGSPLVRRGLEWIVDFGKIRDIQTSIRLDGRYYYYKSIDEIITPDLSLTSTRMENGELYKYIGFYVGKSGSPVSVSNGSINKQLLSNLTFITHIPAVRLIVSLRIESSLYNYSRNLSEYEGQPHGFVLDKRDDFFPSETKYDIYAGNQFVGKYPLFYISYDNPDVKIPFAEALRNAYENGGNNNPLYRDLSRMVKRTNYDYIMNENGVSAYASANLAITKEIGNFASITFNARNFLNTMQLVKEKWTNQQTSLIESRYIPGFYYGLSLKLKF